jgi:predicted GIY-YIG superfamily endonuclease
VSTPRFSVYALELPDGTVYVGSTAKPVRERLAEHRAQRGARCRLLGSIIRGAGTTRAQAERVEAAVARDLRRRGYTVTQG